MAFEGTFRSYFGAVCVPILDNGDGTVSNVTHDWANSAASLGGGLAVTVLRLQIRNFRVDLAKERLAELALANHVHWMFFLDDDVICPPDTLLKMIKLWRSDPKYKVISGVYWSKSDPPHPLIFRGNLEGSYWDWTVQDLITADGAGAGCLFVDAEVFKKMKRPWFSNQYFFEDPRMEYDVEKWRLTDLLGVELIKGKDANQKIVKDLEKQLAGVGEKIKKAQSGFFDPELLNNKRADAQTTEDLYFFKKMKEELGLDLWVDCSIQAQHQDKRSGRFFGLTPDMPQARPRFENNLKKRGDKIILDLGSGNTQYYMKEGIPIRVDIDPNVKPDVIADVRSLPFNDCYADIVVASHILEHFSFRETISVLKEWIRVLKIDGELRLFIPNLRWAAKRILNPPKNQDEAERTMFMYYSGQRGDLKEAYTDTHYSGFTPDSLKETLERLGSLKDIKIYTSEGNYGIWDDPELLHQDMEGYNIVAVAKKAMHRTPISLKVPLAIQEEAMKNIGEKAKLKETKKRTKKEVKKNVS